MKSTILTVLNSLVGLAFAANAVAQTGFQLLPPGEVYGISPDGGTIFRYGQVWRQDTGTASLPSITYTEPFRDWAVGPVLCSSWDGSKLGGFAPQRSGFGVGRSFLSSAGTIGLIGPDASTDFGGVRAMSYDGTVAVGSAYGPLGGDTAFRWDGTSLTWLARAVPPGPATFHCAFGVTANGSVAVGRAANKAARWFADGSVEVLTAGANSGLDENLAAAYAVNADGSVIVGQASFVAFKWTSSTGMQRLDSVLEQAQAIAVSADGAVVGGWGYLPTGSSFGNVAVAVIWTGGHMHDLKALAASQGITIPASVSLARLMGMSADASRFVGMTGGQQPQPFLLTLGSPSGACCFGTTCTFQLPAGCSGSFQGPGTTCGPVGNPTTCCPANFNRFGGVSLGDIFDYLNAWFSTSPDADFNRSGSVTLQDIFDFLNAWFAGC